MKKCPYCAELIQDEAIKCRYCGSDLTTSGGQPADPAQSVPSPEPALAGPSPEPGSQPMSPGDAPSGLGPVTTPAPAGPRIGEGALRYSHSGHRYVLGYGRDYFGIWDRETPGGPVARFPRTDTGWEAAWNQFTAWEPRAIAVPQTGTPPDVRSSATPFRSAHSLARWAAGLLALTGFLAVLNLIFRSIELSLLTRIQNGGLVSNADRRASNARLASLGGIIGVASVATIIVWLVWQYRAQANLRALGVADLRFSPGWAVGWWFIPFANFVMPYLTMRELWKASDPDSGAADWKMQATTPLLGVWWTAWLVRLAVLPSLAFNAAPEKHPPVSELISRDHFLLASDAVTILAAILAIVLVRTIDARQQAKHERLATWSSGTAA